MIKYRPHRGSLADSLKEQKDYVSLLALMQDIKFNTIEFYGYDWRCNQVLFIVLDSSNIPMGFVVESLGD